MRKAFKKLENKVNFKHKTPIVSVNSKEWLKATKGISPVIIDICLTQPLKDAYEDLAVIGRVTNSC